MSPRLLASLALLGNALLWGLALPIVKKGYENGLSPDVFLITRMFLAGLLALPFLFIFRKDKSFSKAFNLKNLTKIISLEVIGNVLALFFLYLGLLLTTSIESTLITMTLPIFTVIGGVVLLHEKEDRREWLGLFLALAGTTLLVIKPLLTTGINGSLEGNLYILLHNVFTMAYFLLAKRHYQKLNKFAVSLISFWVSGIGFYLLYQTPPQAIISALSQLTFWPIFAILYMATFGSIFALTLYHIGLSRIEASEASLFTYLQPVFALPAAFVLVGEIPSLIEILALGIIILGVYLAEKRASW